MQTKIIDETELLHIAEQMLRIAISGGDSAMFVAVSILTGDRVTCCDEAVVFACDSLCGVATIAPLGEMGEGLPTIVGLYVRQTDRRKGYGSVLLEAAVRRCLDRGFEIIRIDAVTTGALRVIGKLPVDLQKRLEVHDVRLPGF